MAMRRAAPIRFMLGASLVLGIAATWAPVASASGGTYYVDGKTGSDSHDGKTPGTAFKRLSASVANLRISVDVG